MQWGCKHCRDKCLTVRQMTCGFFCCCLLLDNFVHCWQLLYLGFFCLFAYALPSSFVHGYRNIPNSLENFLCSDLKRLNSVPRELSGSWIKLCGKILYLLPSCHCSRCWIFFYWLVNLSFCGSNVPKSPKFLLLCRVFLSSCKKETQTVCFLSSLQPVQSPKALAFPGFILHQRVLCASQKNLQYFLFFYLTYSISEVCLYVYSSSTLFCLSKLQFWVEPEMRRGMSFYSPRGKKGSRTLQVKFLFEI